MEVILALIVLGFILYIASVLITWKTQSALYEKTKAKLTECEVSLKQWQAREGALISAEQNMEIALQNIRNIRADLEIIDEQKRKAFPWLAKAYADYFELLALKDADYLESKTNPAPRTAAEIRKIHAAKIREATREAKYYSYIINYYESLFPGIEDYLDKEDEDQIQNQDPATDVNSLTDRENQELKDVEKNQLVLDRWWRRNKSKWEIGLIYERYVGSLWEKNGAWKVEYTGALKRLEDMGRDLIVEGYDSIKIIQCKNWSRRQNKIIHENHIMQFYGSIISYTLEHPHNWKKIEGIFYTTVDLSDTAKRIAEMFNIMIQKTDFPANGYPMIKCNVSHATNEKIYHLPFDQQYDTVVIDKRRGEFYAQTCQEAEGKGFRRAWRWNAQT